LVDIAVVPLLRPPKELFDFIDGLIDKTDNVTVMRPMFNYTPGLP